MLYIVNCLLHGDVLEYVLSLQHDIAVLTGSAFMEQQSIAPHFTLKYWFKTDDIEPIDTFVRDFCSTHDKAPVRIGGFNHFDENVVFLDVERSSAAQDLFCGFITGLRRFSWMQWDRFDGENLHFHVTIADRAREKFGEIRIFLQGKERYFNSFFDNITIYKMVAVEQKIDRYAVHSTCRLK